MSVTRPAGPPPAGGTPASDERLGSLRGASVEVDVRRVTRAFLLLVGIGLLVTAGVLIVAGADKNAQIGALKSRGVQTSITVSSCRGLLGGSGSNAAGYACRGTFRFDGHGYDEYIPGNVYRAPHSTVRIVTDPDDPALISTTSLLASEHPSARVFITPGVLILVALLGAVLVSRRQRRRAQRVRAGGV